MQRPDVDPDHVQMSDILCDFCHRPWTEDIAMVEGHHGSCICGHCLTLAYTALVLGDEHDLRSYTCTLCLESEHDRAAENRPDLPGWRSPLYEDAVICRRCVKLGAGVLHKDPDFDWRKPESPGG